MVASRNLSAYPGDPPDDPASGRKIAGGPVYELKTVKGIAKTSRAMTWTNRCVDDLADLGFSLPDVLELIQELSEQNYRDSEWCENGSGYWVACDSYYIVRKEYMPVTGKTHPIEYFLKFAVAKSGLLLLLVSCHPPRQR